MKRGDFRSRINPKPPPNEEMGIENLERENYDRLVGDEKFCKWFILPTKKL